MLELRYIQLIYFVLISSDKTTNLNILKVSDTGL